jgi:hypothetical protein
MLAACGSSGGGKKPDGGKDGSNTGDHPTATGAAGSEADAAADVGPEAPDDGGADTPTGGAGGAAGTGGGAGAGGAAGSDAAATADATDGAAMTDARPDAAEVEVAAPRLVTVAFTGKVSTVSGTPLGFDSTVGNEAVSGSFTYDANLGDNAPTDPLRGKYYGNGNGSTAFTFMVKGHTVTGSGKAVLETENFTSSDTFRFRDGKQPLDPLARTMQFDGADALTLTLLIAITDDTGAMLTSDVLPDPFPTVNIAHKDGGFNISHTFSLQDSGGTLLMQLDTLVSQ